MVKYSLHISCNWCRLFSDVSFSIVKYNTVWRKPYIINISTVWKNLSCTVLSKIKIVKEIPENSLITG